MLVLSRKVGEKLVIDDNITITITELAGGRVKIGIEAPRHVSILRGELAAGQEVADFRKNWTAADEVPAAPVHEEAKPQIEATLVSISVPSALQSQPKPHARLRPSLRRLLGR
jgi:carbon storage regulator